MTIMLLMGSVCLAQEAKKDSIWGLEVSDVNTEGYMSITFYTNIEKERLYGIEGEYYDNNNENFDYFFLNSYLFSKAGVTCDYIPENDSIYKITLYNVNLYSNTESLIIYIRVTQYENSNILRWNKDKTIMGIQRVENEAFDLDRYKVVYIDMAGRHTNIPPHGYFLKCYYEKNRLRFVSKHYNS